MIKRPDLYTAAATFQIPKPSASEELYGDEDTTASKWIGTAVIQYEVSRYVDLRNLDEAKPKRFLVKCTQRLRINCPDEPDVGYMSAVYSFYPAMLKSTIVPTLEAGSTVVPDDAISIVEYWPRTINSSVSTDASHATSNDRTVSRQHTSGSNVSETNSYGISVTGGAEITPQGPGGSLSVTGNYEHSDTVGSSTEDSRGSTLGHGAQVSGTVGMTLKDWAAAAVIQGDGKTVQWLWGQEYPWNAFKFRPLSTGSTVVALPQYVIDVLQPDAGKIVEPPSYLALFGFDFATTVTWLISVPLEAEVFPTLTFEHRLSLGRGSHQLDSNGTTLDVTLDVVKPQLSTGLDPLDLDQFALDPIADSSDAIVGFWPSSFDLAPAGASSSFRITSPENNVCVRGTGFSEPMQTDLSNGAKATLDIYFKILDPTEEYLLYLKHWKTDDAAVRLAFTTPDGTTVWRHVDDSEGEGGENNLTAISLRNTDYSSTDYHDYLRLGLNHISVAISASTDDEAPGGSSACGYAIRALAIR